jgi:hypothetical protein
VPFLVATRALLCVCFVRVLYMYTCVHLYILVCVCELCMYVPVLCMRLDLRYICSRCRRLQGSLWADTLEVNDRRNKYLQQEHERGPVLGDIAKSLLDRDATSRLSASELRVCLDKPKKRLEQDEEAREEERARARALQVAEDARVARALQAEEEEQLSAAVAEKQRQEEEKAAAAAEEARRVIV